MSDAPAIRETSLAVLTRHRPDYVEVHYNPGVVINTAGLGEVQQARRELMGRTPYGMLSFIPHDADFELAAANVDHLASDRHEGALKAIAIVTGANMMEMVLKLYFAYFPQHGHIKVSTSEKEARAWVEAQLKELARSS